MWLLPKKFKMRCEGKHRDESQVPGLVNPSMLKDGKDGTQRLNGTMRKKMGEFNCPSVEVMAKKESNLVMIYSLAIV